MSIQDSRFWLPMLFDVGSQEKNQVPSWVIVGRRVNGAQMVPEKIIKRLIELTGLLQNSAVLGSTLSFIASFIVLVLFPASLPSDVSYANKQPAVKQSWHQ